MPVSDPVNILLVDDEPRNLDVLESLLDCPEHHLVRAGNADAALKAIMAQEFAVLVLDVRMPDISGVELAQLIKQRKKTQHLPIIFLTAYQHEDSQVLQGYSAGGVDYISKPCNPDILRSKVAVFVDLYRKTGALEAEVRRRQQVEEDLRQAYGQMEARVRERTLELEQANGALRRSQEELRQLSADLERKVVSRTAELQQKADQLRVMAAELTRAEETQRKRLAQLLHDGVQQLLVGARMRADSLKVRLGEDQAREQLVEVVSILGDAIKATRFLTAELSPPVLHDAGLVPALGWLARWCQDKHQTKVEVDADFDAEPTTEDKRVLLFQAARELLFNTVKHAQTDTARVSLCRIEGGVHLTVEDEGDGFDPAADSPEGRTAGGFGLFNLRQRVELLDGRLTVDSAPGRGTRVRVSLPDDRPAAASAPASVEALKAERAAAPPVGGPIRVLLVDDHSIVRQGLKLALAEGGVEVIGEASDGQEAADLAAQLRPDVVVMDVSMPRVNGVEATRRIVAILPDVYVLGLSMHQDADMADSMRRAGAKAFISKDCPAAELVAAVHACRAGATAGDPGDSGGSGGSGLSASVVSPESRR